MWRKLNNIVDDNSVIIEVHEEEKFQSALDKCLHGPGSTADTTSGFFVGKGSARYHNFLSTIHLQSFRFKESLGGHQWGKENRKETLMALDNERETAVQNFYFLINMS